MQADAPHMQLVGHGRAAQGQDHQHRADHLGDDRGQGRARDAQVEAHHQNHVQDDVGHAGGDEEQQRTAGIAHGPQHAAADVVDQGEHNAAEVDADVGHGVVHDVLGGTHQAQHRGRQDQPQHHHDRAAQQGQRRGGMHGVAHVLLPPCAVELGDQHRRAGGQSHEEAHQQVDQHAGGAAHGSQGFLAHILAHDHGVGGVVQLLEERAQQDGEEENQQLPPDHALGDAVGLGAPLPRPGHALSAPFVACVK